VYVAGKEDVEEAASCSVLLLTSERHFTSASLNWNLPPAQVSLG